MKSLRTPISSFVRGRFYATRAATKQKEQKINPHDAKVSRLPGGLMVVSVENCSPVSSLAIVYNTGARHEAPTELGLTHCLRMAVTQSTQKATAFAVAKNLQQVGSTLTCTISREQTTYSIECLRNQLSTGLEYLTYVATSPAFKTWELEDTQARLKIDLEVHSKSLNTRLLEAVHKAAYRDTLGQSLYMNPDRLGSFTPHALETFVHKNYVSHNAAVIGVGIDHDALAHAVRKLPVRQGPVPTVGKAKYHGGGEIRVDAAGELVHAVLVHEGVSLDSADVVPAFVFRQAMGGSPWVQYGLNASSKINKAAMTVTNQPFTASCINLSYSDSGLFGIHAVADPIEIGKVVRAAVGSVSQTLKNGLTEAEVERAKAGVKSLLMSSSNDSATVVESLASQVFYSSEPMTAAQLASAVDKVTADDVNKVAKKITSSKPCMAAVGNLMNTPYLDELVQ